MSRESGVNQNIFGQTKERDQRTRPRLALAHHNVGQLLPRADEKTRRDVNARYIHRSGANNYEAEIVGALVDEPTDELRKHTTYLSGISNREIRVFTPEDVQRHMATDPETHGIVVPYINDRETAARMKELGLETWGWPPEMVHAVKDKTQFHALVDELDVEGFEVPEYAVADKDNYMEQALGLLGQSEDTYRRYGMGQYPRGVMLRLDEADGGYGSVMVRQRGDGKIVVKPLGEKDEAVEDDWVKALTKSETMLYSEGTDHEAQVVISRLLDLDASPGISTIFLDGKAHSLGWNDQLQLPGDAACVGTSNFVPKNEHERELQARYEAQSAEAFARFTARVAERQGISMEDVRGIANADFMIPGAQEMELRRRRGQGEGVYVAEVNPRWTNFTDAVLASVAAEQRRPTVSDMRSVVAEGISTIDKYQIPSDVDPEAIRDEVYERDQELKRTGDARVIVRMPVDPIGVIFLGDRRKAQAEFQEAIEAARGQRHA